MKAAYYIRSERHASDSRVVGLLDRLTAGGWDVARVRSREDLPAGADLILSFGGDGTFLSAASFAAPAGIPVLGVNLGRLGFLSEHQPEVVADALLEGNFSVEERQMLRVCHPGGESFALNETAVLRSGAAMLGVDVAVDGTELPTYWADGLLVATSSGSTAYSLSAGGPICLPDSRVMIITPIAPHNLNVRPLVVPDSSKVRISLRSRDRGARLTVDNSETVISSDAVISIEAAPFRLKKLCPGGSNFIDALRSRLLWGADVRNEQNK